MFNITISSSSTNSYTHANLASAFYHSTETGPINVTDKVLVTKFNGQFSILILITSQQHYLTLTFWLKSPHHLVSWLRTAGVVFLYLSNNFSSYQVFFFFLFFPCTWPLYVEVSQNWIVDLLVFIFSPFPSGFSSMSMASTTNNMLVPINIYLCADFFS